MPELPEVETIRRSLSPHLVGRKILGVVVADPSAIWDGEPEEFRQALVGRSVAAVERRGKYLLLRLDTGARFGVHLRMTGRLLWGEDRAGRVRVQLTFEGGERLVYEDRRRLGGMFLVREGGRAAAGVDRLGVEPLEPGFTAGYLGKVLRGRRAPIKAVLLDQRRVAGVGNIYADEALFAAGIHPARAAGSLRSAEVERLCAGIVETLQAALEAGGTTFDAYLDATGRAGSFAGHLNVYGRAGQPCRRCGQAIVRLRVAGRGTHLCPTCQR